MKKHILLLMCVVFFINNKCFGGWRRELVGNLPVGWGYQIVVGEGRNDDTSRVYVSTTRGPVYEITYRNGNWDFLNIGGPPQRTICLVMGDGRNDGRNRLYGASEDRRIYEFSYENGNWVVRDIGPPYVFFAGVGLGNGRNDGIIRVYGGGFYSPTYEKTWTGTDWSNMTLSPRNTNIWPLAVGDGRNDGINRIYCPDGLTPTLYEYTWDGSAYAESLITFSMGLTKVVVGDGRGDGINRVYVGERHNNAVWELTYTTGNWTRLNICSGRGYVSRYGICIGKTRADGKPRVYTTGQFGDIREHSWDGTAWVDSVIDAVSQATSDLTIGKGRNDDTVRIYATGGYGGSRSIYEFTHPNPYVDVKGVEEDSKYKFGKIWIYPNPCHSKAYIRIEIKKATHLNIKIYNIKGDLVKEINKSYPQGVHTIILDGISSGVYFCKIKTDRFIWDEKFILLN